MIHRTTLHRLARVALLLAASAAAIWLHEEARPDHPHLPFLTGWALLALMLVLTLYNARKKIAFIPLLSSRLWLQFHIYLGLFTGLAFLLHIAWRWPGGVFETLLAAAFAAVTLSGIVGWWLSRAIPRRLTTVGGEVPYERIPIIARDIRLKAEAMVLQAIPKSKATTLADFYAARLASFFDGPGNLGPHLLGSRRTVNNHLAHLAEVRRYLSAEEKNTADQLGELIRRKDALDFHRAGQLVLKSWLFVHIPLTYGLLVLTLVHIYLVYAYSGGAR